MAVAEYVTELLSGTGISSKSYTQGGGTALEPRGAAVEQHERPVCALRRLQQRRRVHFAPVRGEQDLVPRLYAGGSVDRLWHRVLAAH